MLLISRSCCFGNVNFLWVLNPSKAVWGPFLPRVTITFWVLSSFGLTLTFKIVKWKWDGPQAMKTTITDKLWFDWDSRLNSKWGLRHSMETITGREKHASFWLLIASNSAFHHHRWSLSLTLTLILTSPRPPSSPWCSRRLRSARLLRRRLVCRWRRTPAETSHRKRFHRVHCGCGWDRSSPRWEKAASSLGSLQKDEGVNIIWFNVSVIFMT